MTILKSFLINRIRVYLKIPSFKFRKIIIKKASRLKIKTKLNNCRMILKNLMKSQIITRLSHKKKIKH